MENKPGTFSAFLDRTEKIFSDSRIVFFIFAVLSAIVFWPALGGDFVGDDTQRIIEFEPLVSGGLSDLLSYYRTDRPIVMFTVWLNYKVAGLDPFVYKLTNLIFHLLCGFSGFLLLRRLFREFNFKNNMAFFATAVFLVHPLNHLVVQVAVQRSVSMAGLFLILSFLKFIDFFESKKKKAFLLSLFLYLLAVLSKPTSIALPAVLLVYLFHKRAKVREMLKWVPVYFIFWLIPIWNYGAPTTGPAEFKFENWRYFLVQTKVFFIYVYKFFVPFPMEYIHELHNSVQKIYDGNFVFYAMAYAGIFISLAFWFFRRRTLLPALLLFAYVLYLPQSSFYSILHVLFYHRVYLSVLFVAAAFSYMAFQFNKAERRVWPAAVLSAVVIYFSVATIGYFSQVKSYSDWLWYNVQANPGNLNFNVSTLFVLKQKAYPPELIQKFSDFILEHNSDPESKFAASIVNYTPAAANAKKIVLEVASYLSSEKTGAGFFQGAMFFLEAEAYKFFQREQAVLSLNSIYFSRLDSSLFFGESAFKTLAKKNFESVLLIQNLPNGVDREKLEFFKLRSRIVLFLIFKVDTGLNVSESLSLLQTKYSQLPETKWLIEKLQNSLKTNP